MGNLVNLPNISADVIDSLNFDTPKTSKKVSTFDEKNYLNVRLGEKEDSREIRIRLLPMDLKTGNPFVRTYFHTVTVPKEVSPSGFKSFLCLHRNEEIDHEKFGDACPFCELNKNAYEASLKETDSIVKSNYQKLSLNNIAREAVIVRCIERGKENEGVKFWKFNLSHRKDDPFHTIMDLYRSAKNEGASRGENVNIFDLYHGNDLVINLKRNVNNDRDMKTSILISTARYESPLTNSQEELESWIYDEKKWYEVFTPKPYEYLKLISEGRIPWYDRNTGKWVDKDEFNSDKIEEETNAENDIRTAENAIMEQTRQFTQSPMPENTFSDDTFSAINADNELPF